MINKNSFLKEIQVNGEIIDRDSPGSSRVRQ